LLHSSRVDVDLTFEQVLTGEGPRAVVLTSFGASPRMSEFCVKGVRKSIE
jgi:hypothetical protein